MILTQSGLARLAKAILVCVCSVGFVAAQTATIADCENGTNQNNFGAYWYAYTDYEDGGNTTIDNATPNADGTYEFTVTEGEGNPSGTPGYGAMMEYTLGDTDPGSGAIKWGSIAGLGTMLALEGEVCDITGATTITYWAKADPPVDVRVEIATSAVTDFCYHHTIHSIGATWEKQTITLSEPLGIQQYSWGDEVAFDPTTVEKVQWAISEDEGAMENSSGTIWIDDIQIQPYTYVPADACPTCVSAPGVLPNNFLLADMEITRNGLGYYTYCYNDVEARAGGSGYSEIFEGVDAEDPETPILVLDGGNGQGGTEGAHIGFQLGTTYEENGNTILPFCGVGTNLADDLGLEPFNATAAGCTGIYFQYKTSGPYDYVSLEVESDQNFGNTGAVYYVKLPATGGEWKAATVPFSKMVLPAWEDVTPSPLDKKKLLKLQWKVQAASGTEGTLTVDNVVLLGVSKDFDPSLHVTRSRQMSSRWIAVNQKANVVEVHVPGAASVALMDMAGRVMARGRMRIDNFVWELPITGASNGAYLVRITPARDGPAVVVPVSIVK